MPFSTKLWPRKLIEGARSSTLPLHLTESNGVHASLIKGPETKLKRIRDDAEAVERLMCKLRIEGKAVEDPRHSQKHL